VKIWQAGSSLTDERGGEVHDWSWRRMRRRVGLLGRLTLPYKSRTALALATLLAYTLVALAPPYLAKLAIDEGIAAGDLSRLTAIVALFLGAAVAAVLLSGANTYLTGWTGERVLADLRNTLFAHLERLSLGFYERNRAGVIISRITNDVEALDQLVTDGVTSLVQNTLLLVGTAVVLFLLDWQLALATLTVLPLMALATAWFRTRSNRAYRRVRERLGLVTATLAEDIAGMRVVQSFTREPVQQRAFHGVNDSYRAANYETVVLNGIYFPVVDLLASAATAIVFGYGGWLVYHGDMTAGTLFAFAPLSTRSSACSTSSRRSSTLPVRSRCRGSRATSASTASASATGPSSRRSCTASTSTSRPVRRSRSSATRARASRRSRS
jgi:ATP-binding cassette subfamily B protein